MKSNIKIKKEYIPENCPNCNSQLKMVNISDSKDSTIIKNCPNCTWSFLIKYGNE